MNRRNQDAILIARILSDLVMVSAAWVAAYYLRFRGLIDAPKGIPEPFLYFKLIPFICVIWFAILAASGFYRRTGRHRSPFVEGLDIIQGCVLATLTFIAFTYIYEEYRYSRLTMLFFTLLHPWMIIGGRSVIRKTLRYYKRRSPPRRTLLIGSGESLHHAIDAGPTGDFSRGEFSGAILVGDDDEVAVGRRVCEEKGIAVYPQQTDWATFFSNHPAESVVIALPHKSYDFLDQELENIADQVPDVKLLPDLLRYTRFTAGIDIVSGIPVISIHDSPLAGMGSALKRLMDIGGSLVGLILFSPLMTVAALAIRATSHGSIFYRQERMGLDGRTFRMLKFRSMPEGAESKTGAVWATAEDNRVTRVGRFLRRSSIDELPQLFNVLKGDMSLVGPRPERPVFVEQFRRRVPGYYLRHKAKAGLTGWAQVNGWRGNTSIEKRIECDLFYIQNWSIWFDVRILFMTVFRGFINKNAY